MYLTLAFLFCFQFIGDYATVSVVIPSINGIMYQLNALKTEINNNESTSSTSPAKEKEKPLPTPLAKVFLQRALYFAKTEFKIFEEKDCLVLGSILDPRFKKESITNGHLYDEGKKFTIQEITKILKKPEAGEVNDDTENSNKNECETEREEET